MTYRSNVLRERDPLLDGPGKTWTAWLPTSLIDAIKEGAAADGYRSASSYTVDLLAYALRARAVERAAEKKPKSR